MRNYTFVTNYLESDNWVQFYCEQVLIWEAEIAWQWVEPVSDAITNNEMSSVEIEFVTDDEMADYSN